LQMIQGANMRLVARPGFRDTFISAVHPHDLVRGITLAAERGTPLPSEGTGHVLNPETHGAEGSAEGIYFIDDGGQHTIASFGHLAAEALGKKAITLPIPYPIAWIAGLASELVGRLRWSCPAYNLDKVAASFATGWWCDSSRARKELGYEPEMPLDLGLPQTVAWLREHGVL
ncbi:MAG: hypothetical protein VX498_07095, partial [Myxococcota bacterium]|nr:hypothetical protein [Myxococcota bacterium]